MKKRIEIQFQGSKRYWQDQDNKCRLRKTFWTVNENIYAQIKKVFMQEIWIEKIWIDEWLSKYMELIIIIKMATHRHALVGLIIIIIISSSPSSSSYHHHRHHRHIIITVIMMMTTHGHAMVGLNEAKSRGALWVCGKLDHLATWENINITWEWKIFHQIFWRKKHNHNTSHQICRTDLGSYICWIIEIF